METMSDFRPWKRNLLSKMPYPTVTQPYSERFAKTGIHLKGCTEQAKMYAPKHISSKVWGVGVGALLFGNLQVTNLRNLSFRAPPPGRLVQLLRAIAQSRTCSSLTQIPPPPTCRSGCASQGGSQHYGFQAMRIGYCCKPTRVYPKNWSIPIAAIAGFGRCLLEVA